MASNVSEVNKMIMALSTEPLTMSSWLDWEWGLVQAIKNSNVWEAVMQKDATGNPPAAPTVANPAAPTAVEQAHVRAWNDQRAYATRWITTAAGRVNSDISDRYQTSHDAPALLAELETRFFPKDVNAQLTVLKDLFSLPKTSEDTWDRYFAKQDDTAKRFSQVFPAGIPTERLKELLFMLNTLSHLPQTHPIRTSALSPNSNVTSDGVRASIRAHIAQNGVEPTSVESASQATTSAKKCLFCHYSGHRYAECNFAKFYQEQWKVDRANRTGPYAHRQEGTSSQGSSSRHTKGGHGRSTTKANQAVEGIVDALPLEESAGNASLSTPLSKFSADHWIADSGASKCMTFRREWIHGFRVDRRPIRLADGTVIFSAGIGFIFLVPHSKSSVGAVFRIESVLYVPDLRSNLLSVFFLTAVQRYKSIIIGRKMSFYIKDALAFTATLKNDLTAFVDATTMDSKPQVAAYSARADDETSLDLWHARFCHRSEETIERAVKLGAVTGVKSISQKSGGRPKCISCLAGKMTRASHAAPAERASEPLERIVTDVHGPVEVKSREGFEYWVTFIDQYSGFAALYCIRKKSDVFTAFKQYKAFAENSMKSKIQHLDDAAIRKTIRTLRDDKGGEYSSNEFRDFLIEHGIQREHTIRDTPQQNGLAERLNRTISESITAMLDNSKLPRSMWADAARVAIYVHNRTPSHSRDFKTPYELWSGQPPSVANLRVFGCRAYVHIQKDQRPQLSSHARKCIFIGYAPEHKGYTFYDSEKGGTFISDSAVFIENEFPGTLRIQTASTSHNTPQQIQYLDGTDPTVAMTRLTPRLPAPPAPPSRVSPPPRSTFIRPERVPLPESDSESSAETNPPKQAPEARDSPEEQPTVTDDGNTIKVRLPGRHHPGDPSFGRGSEDHVVPKEVDRLLDPAHFEAGRPPLDLPRTRSGREHARSAFWFEDDSDEAEWEESNNHQATNATEVTPRTVKLLSADRDRPLFIPRSSPAKQSSSKSASSALVSLENCIDFAFHASTSLEPNSLTEARSRPDADKWVNAAIEEIKAHLENGTWELCRLPKGKRAIGSRWVFKIKRNADGSIDRYKGRLVAKGYAQREGVDYTETFAPTARFAALRTVIALAAIEDWELEAVDISTAFLNGDIDADVYMKIPEGVAIEGASEYDWVLKLLKGLYGIKQGPRLWNRKLHETLTTMGFTRLDCDHSVYVYERDDIQIIVPIHVDDLIIASKSKSAIANFKAELGGHFKIRDLGPIASILGIQVERNRADRTITLSQTSYIDTILAKHAPFEAFNGADVPMTTEPLSEKMCPSTDEEKEKMSSIPYREVVGQLLYLAIATRPDLAYAVGVLCRFNANPGLKHWAAVKHVLRYLKHTRHYKLHYAPNSSTEPFTTFCDADLGGNIDNSRSTSGYAMRVGTGAVMWGSRLQRHVSLSSTESEYTTASATATEVMWMRYLFEEIGYDMSKPSTLWMDSNSAIQVAKNPEHVSTMKHVHRAYHWIREQVENGNLTVGHIPGNENPADIFTKPLARVKFQLFRDMLGVRP